MEKLLTRDPHVFISWKIYIYDGKTGEKVCALGGSKAHDGGIYAVSMSVFPSLVVGIWPSPCVSPSIPNLELDKNLKMRGYKSWRFYAFAQKSFKVAVR